MNILIFNWNESFIKLLANTGFNFYVIPWAIYGILSPIKKSPFWEPIVDIPQNCTLITDPSKVKDLFFSIDLIICSTKLDLEMTFNFPIPKIFIPLYSVKEEIGEENFNDPISYNMYCGYLNKITKDFKVLFVNSFIKEEGKYQLSGDKLVNEIFINSKELKCEYDKTKEEDIINEFKFYLEKTVKDFKSDTKINKDAQDIILWEGPLFSHHSLALVNREINLELIKNDKYNVILNSGREYNLIFDEIKYTDLDNRLYELSKRETYLYKPPTFHISHQWPPSFIPSPLFGHWILFQPWEFGYLPKDWIEPIKTLIDEVWVYTNDNKETYVRSGIPSDKVQVIPLGVNPEIFNPEVKPTNLKTNKKFKFIYVGGMNPRKGVDILFEAYLKEFNKEDDVCLVIKDYAKPMYKGEETDVKKQIQEVNLNPKTPEILYIDDNLTEPEIASLLKACQCYVHPYKSEGFGLPIAEAMACGLPVIITGKGAALDFCNEDIGYLLPATIEYYKENKISDGRRKVETVDIPFWAKPDLNELRKLMRHVYNNYSEAKLKGKKASEFILNNFTWAKSANKILERLEVIKDKPILRFYNSQFYTLLEEAKLQYSLKNFDKSKFYFNKLLEHSPNNPTLLHGLACIELFKNNYKDSIDYLYKAWKFNLEHNEILKVLTDLFYKLGKVDLANSAFLLTQESIVVWKAKSLFDLPFILSHNIYINNSNLPYVDIYCQCIEKKEDIDKINCNYSILRLVTDEYIPIDNDVDLLCTLDQEQKLMYIKNGFPEEKIFVLPLSIDLNIFSPNIMPCNISDKKEYSLLFAGEWEKDKTFIYELISKYLNSFNSNDCISLILYIYSSNFSTTAEKISNYIDNNFSNNSSLADIILLEGEKELKNIASIFSAVNCYISNKKDIFKDYYSLISMAMKKRVININELSNFKNIIQNINNIEQNYNKVLAEHNLDINRLNLTKYIKNKRIEELFNQLKLVLKN